MTDKLTPEQVVQILERGTTIPGDGWSFEQIDEALHIACREVSKQIPKPPRSGPWQPNCCPTCNADLGGKCEDGFYQNPWFDRCPACGQRLDYQTVPAYELHLKFESPTDKIFDDIVAAVKDFMCPGPCDPDCPLCGNHKTVLPDGRGCHMCHPEYATTHPKEVAKAMGYRIISQYY